MAKLTEQHKSFVVMRLACFRTPTEVCEEVKDVFGLELPRQQVHYYDPTVPSNRTPKKWAALFEATRKEYLKGEAEVGVAYERYRLEELQRMYERAKSMGKQGNIPLAQSLLEQAAKEKGGHYTNHRVLEHSGQVKTSGVLLVPAGPDLSDWTKTARAQQKALAEEAAKATEATVGAGS